jgi:YD repeat-containing protein
VGWFDHELNKLGGDAERLTSGAQHLAGHVLDDGAHGVGDALSAVGLGGAARTVDRAGDDVANDLGDQIPEKQLGQTTDPAELIHGDQGALTKAAGKLKAFSAAFGATADGLSGIDTEHWTGQAAAAFRARYAPQPDRWQDASSACGRAAGALLSYAQTVEWAQGQARQAIEVYQQGQQATATARATYAQQASAYNQAAQVYDSRLASGSSLGTRPTEPGSFTDPGEGLRAQAQRILTRARQQRDQAAAQAQSRITAATELAPAEPSFTRRLLGDVSDLYQADQLASVSFADGALQGTADMVKLVRSLNPDDPWNRTHLAEYVGGLSATGTALAHDALHPGALAEGLAGSGWSSDPAEALGRLVPNVALAVGTDGAGTVADAGESVAERAAVDSGEAGLRDAAADPASAGRSPSDMTLQGDPVDVASGDVILGQADVRLEGTLPLVVERAHRSSYRAGRWFGRSWASTFDQRLEVGADGAFFAVADGVVLAYPLPGEDGGPVLPASGARWPLAREAGGSYTVTDPQAGRVWRFASRSGYFVAESGRGELPLISVTDRAGHQIAFSYDEEGAPTGISHDGGYQVRVAAAGGRITALYLTGAGHGGGDVMLARYSYDGVGNLSEVVNSSGRPLRLSYDDAGRLTGWEDRNGWAYQYGYDADGRCVRAEGPGGTLSGTFSYDRDNLVTRYTDAAGAVTVYQLSERSQVATETDPMGNVTRQEHDEYGRLMARADPLGRITRYSYDQAGNLIAITRPDRTQAVAEYGALNLPVMITEPGGAQWRQEFDPAGNRIRLTDPAGACTESSYDQRGHLASITDPAGAKTRVRCDAAGLPVAVTAPDGALTRYERDGFGQITGITGPDGSVTRLSWTTEGRLASRTFPDGATERYAYDGEGNLTAHVDPAAGLTRTEYTCFDQVAARTGPDGARIEFGYDTALRLTTVTIPDGGGGGLTWGYDYDPAGRLTAETGFNGAVTRYAHDGAGQLTEQVNGAAQQLSYRYDLLGNMTERRAGNVVTSYGYDDAGRLVQAANPDADLRLDRDALGRVTAETCNGRTVRSAYDAAGRRVRRVTSTGAETTWDYDLAGRPLRLQAAGQSIRFGYDAAGRETVRQLPGGATLAQQWDPASRLASQVLTGAAGVPFPRNGAGVRAAAGAGDGTAAAGRLLQRRAYRYRSDGCLAGVEDLLAGSRRFALDPAGRVTGVSGPGWAESYRYDLAGNITAAAWPAPPGSPDMVRGAGTQGPRQYAGTLIRSAGSVRYRHDGQGRVVVRQQVRLSRKPGTWQYTWTLAIVSWR